MDKLKTLIIVITLLAAANLTVIIFLSGEKDMSGNGVTLIEKKRDFTKTVTICLMIKGGVFNENERNNGIGALFSKVWVKSNKILETAEFYGGSISAKISPYALEVSLSVPTEYMNNVMDDFTRFLNNPDFSDEIFLREQALHIEELKTALDNPNLVAYNGFNALAYKGSPYALQTDGTIPSVQKLTAADIKEYYKNNIKGGYIVASVAGKYDKALTDKLRYSLSLFDKGEPFKYDCEGTEIAEERRLEEIDSRLRQSKLYIGYAAPDAASGDYAALKVLTDLLGGGMSSRYFVEIRKNSGYAYAVHAAYPSRLCESRFIVSIGLDYDNVESAIKKIDEINFNLGDTVTDEEIEKAKKSILGSSLIETQSNAALAWNRAFFETMGLGADFYEKYVDILRNIDKASLLKAAEIFKTPKVIYVLKPENTNE